MYGVGNPDAFFKSVLGEKPKSNKGKLKAGNKKIGYIFHAKRGGYRTFRTKKAAKKAGYC